MAGGGEGGCCGYYGMCVLLGGREGGGMGEGGARKKTVEYYGLAWVFVAMAPVYVPVCIMGWPS